MINNKEATVLSNCIHCNMFPALFSLFLPGHSPKFGEGPIVRQIPCNKNRVKFVKFVIKHR